MKIKTSKSKINCKSFFEKDASVPYFFLHGFTGSYKSWIEIINLLSKKSFAIDITGHGKSIFLNINDEYTVNDWCNEFYLLLNSLSVEKINLCGYSMGGRLAIAFASMYPKKINSLILESTSVGIDESEKRSERYYSDIALAETIKDNINSFCREWSNNALFSNQKKRNRQEWANQKIIRNSHVPEQLSKSLLTFSPSNMIYYEKNFQEFNFNISIINGSEDDKFIKIGKDMTLMNKNAKQYIVKDCNHNTHLESPGLFIDILNETIYE